ncbi:hypothetical protein PCASD_12726 [Puccinia coronata f. sp. avenae]|uniref:Uncharacterized protein n=1 Tax=Puccinia coronata f. sp. avenae TaxID=200324 RepID=A0A2N5UCM0_9BASI|nr:hypothetical protein PCASD_12726 [Puccinia coronata f. sp. avenae]
MSDQSNRELNSRWKDLQSAHYSSSPHLVQQSSANHSSYQINHNHGDYRTNHNYSNHHGLSTSQLGNQIIQFPTPQPASGDFVSRPNPQQQYQSNNPQLPPSTSTAIPPSNSQNLPNVTPKKRPAPRIKPHVRLVPNHIRNREDEANQKQREIQQASICSSAAPAPTGSLAAPAPAVDDSHDVSDENDEDAHGEEDSDLDCNHTTQFDFDIPELSPSPNFPPPLFIASPPSQNLRPENRLRWVGSYLRCRLQTGKPPWYIQPYLANRGEIPLTSRQMMVIKKYISLLQLFPISLHRIYLTFDSVRHSKTI